MRYLMLLLLPWVIGCVTEPLGEDSPLRDALRRIDRSDGISVAEAVIIAQNYLADHRYERFWRLGQPEFLGESKDGQYWSLAFPPLEPWQGLAPADLSREDHQQRFPFLVHVSKGNGQVIKLRMVEEGQTSR